MLAGLAMGLLTAGGAVPAREGDEPATEVEVRRTTDGIPHIRAANWHGLGFGYGYAQAQDALCTLSEAFVTYQGRRAYFFGAEERPRHRSTFGRALNIDLDFFFRAFLGGEVVADFRRQQSGEMNRLVAGFAAGFNRYLHDAKAAARNASGDAPPCLTEEWVQDVSADDIYRRMHAATLAAGYVRFLPEIVSARPPGAGTNARAPEIAAGEGRPLSGYPLGDEPGLGSNALAFGRAATGEEGAVLLGNPHWFWGGPDRLYQAHLTIPGRLDVAGVSFLGVPVIMIGFNRHVAWSHTVSAARRFGLFELALDPEDPTAYRHGGSVEPMAAFPVSVPIRRPDGTVETATRTLHRSRYGPIVDLGARVPAFGWTRERALALRDVNAENFRVFGTFFRWAQASSLDEFVAILREEAAMPWVNTVAIGRGDGRVWFGDIGAVPDVPDELRARCAAPLSAAFATLEPYAPLLDGSRRDCDWRNEPGAVRPGAMPVTRMPELFAEDYVANMNDSYWLTRPAQPLEGYARILGGEGEALALRGQAGHQLARELLRSRPGAARELGLRVRGAALDARAHSAIRFKAPLLEAVCRANTVLVGRDALTGESFDPRRRVDTTDACRALAEWPASGNAGDRGSLLWDAWWTRLRHIPEAEFYRVPFLRQRPLDTPTAPDVGDPRVAEAFGAAILATLSAGRALDAPRGSALQAHAGGRPLAFFGGCSSEGYFTIACAGEGRYQLDSNSHGNSYLQVVRFTERGVEAYTLLAHGQHELALEGGSEAGAVSRYARKEWLRMPFNDEEIERDPALTRILLKP